MQVSILKERRELEGGNAEVAERHCFGEPHVGIPLIKGQKELLS